MVQHPHLLQLGQAAVDLARQCSNAKTDHERTVIDRQIEATDREIDRLVYELYGLSEDEIRLVEGAVK